MLASLVLTLLSTAHASTECAARLEIPTIDEKRLERAAYGDSYMSVCRDLHAEVGPIFQYPFASKWLFRAKPLLAVCTLLPKRAGGQWARDQYAILKNLTGRAVHVASPEHFAVIAREADAFGRFYGLRASGFVATLGDTGLLRLENDDPVWTDTHDILAPALTKRRTRTYAPVIERITREAVSGHVDDKNLRLAEFSEWVAMAVSHEVLFGRPMPADVADQLSPVISDVWRGRVEEGHAYTAFRERLAARLDEFAATMTADSLAARMKEEAHRFPKSWWVDQVVTLYFAGADTTRSLLTSALVALAEHPEWATRLRDDPSGRVVEAFVHETSRLASVIGMLQRFTRRDVRFGDHVVPRGTMVQLDFQSVNHMAFARGGVFDPEPLLAEPPPPLSICPYGLGKRVCPGRHLAQVEVETVVRTLARDFDVSPSDQPITYATGRAGPYAASPDARLRVTARTGATE